MTLVRIQASEDSVFLPCSNFQSDEEMEQFIADLNGDHFLIDYAVAQNTPTLDIPDALMSRYRQLYKEWYELQILFEQMYRQQEGLRPFKTPEIPDYRIKRSDT